MKAEQPLESESEPQSQHDDSIEQVSINGFSSGSRHQFFEHQGFGPAYTQGHLNLLNKIGFVHLDQVFTNSEIDRIKAYLSNFPVDCSDNSNYGKAPSHYGRSPSPSEKLDTCYVDNIPVGVNLGYYHQEVVSRCPWFYKIAHNFHQDFYFE